MTAAYSWCSLLMEQTCIDIMEFTFILQYMPIYGNFYNQRHTNTHVYTLENNFHVPYDVIVNKKHFIGFP